MSYKDMTFCNFKECANFNDSCHRAWQGKVADEYHAATAGGQWKHAWGISMYGGKPDCFTTEEESANE